MNKLKIEQVIAKNVIISWPLKHVKEKLAWQFGREPNSNTKM